MNHSPPLLSSLLLRKAIVGCHRIWGHRLTCREWMKSQVNVYCLIWTWFYLGPQCLTLIRGANPSHVRLKGMSKPASSQTVNVEGVCKLQPSQLPSPGWQLQPQKIATISEDGSNLRLDPYSEFWSRLAKPAFSVVFHKPSHSSAVYNKPTSVFQMCKVNSVRFQVAVVVGALHQSECNLPNRSFSERVHLCLPFLYFFIAPISCIFVGM